MEKKRKHLLLGNLLAKDYRRWLRRHGISFKQATIEDMSMARITSGFEDYFGPGKSPFMPIEMLIVEDVLFILADVVPYRLDKWIITLAKMTDTITVQFYEAGKKDDMEKWRDLSWEFDEFMRKPVWMEDNDLPF